MMKSPSLLIATMALAALGACSGTDHSTTPPERVFLNADIVAPPANMASSTDQMVLSPDGQLRLRERQ